MDIIWKSSKYGTYEGWNFYKMTSAKKSKFYRKSGKIKTWFTRLANCSISR